VVNAGLGDFEEIRWVAGPGYDHLLGRVRDLQKGSVIVVDVFADMIKAGVVCAAGVAVAVIVVVVIIVCVYGGGGGD